ncbi:hypothetical protein ZWY2020_048771 [Hordeum vulgare]|nr:hypothetical protein ZWY2020_048771 [Hordeum vulgare]
MVSTPPAESASALVSALAALVVQVPNITSLVSLRGSSPRRTARDLQVPLQGCKEMIAWSISWDNIRGNSREEDTKQKDDLKHPEEVEDMIGGGNKKLCLSLMLCVINKNLNFYV